MIFCIIEEIFFFFLYKITSFIKLIITWKITKMLKILQLAPFFPSFIIKQLQDNVHINIQIKGYTQT